MFDFDSYNYDFAIKVSLIVSLETRAGKQFNFIYLNNVRNALNRSTNFHSPMKTFINS